MSIECSSTPAMNTAKSFIIFLFDETSQFRRATECKWCPRCGNRNFYHPFGCMLLQHPWKIWTCKSQCTQFVWYFLVEIPNHCTYQCHFLCSLIYSMVGFSLVLPSHCGTKRCESELTFLASSRAIPNRYRDISLVLPWNALVQNSIVDQHVNWRNSGLAKYPGLQEAPRISKKKRVLM